MTDERETDEPQIDNEDLLSDVPERLEYESRWKVGEIEPQEVADGIEVSATPEIIGYMEQTVYDGVVPRLPEGHRIVGVRIECNHRAPTPTGETVTVSITVEEADPDSGQITSSATVEDERGVVATGRMRHAVVNREAFAQRVRSRFEGT